MRPAITIACVTMLAAISSAVATAAEALAWKPGPVGCPARFAHTAVWDEVDAGFLVFGGESMIGKGFALRQDLWLYQPEKMAWQEITAAGAPPARGYHASAWDAKRRAMWVFGGAGAGFAPLNELWKYDAAKRTWERARTNGPTPAARISPCLHYWPRADRLVLFGGTGDFHGAIADLWQFDLATATWSQGVAKAPGRWQCASALDEEHGRLVIQGGFDAQAAPGGGTWVCDLRQGEWLDAGAGPRSTEAHAAVWDTAGERLVAYGGALPGQAVGSDELDAWKDGAWKSLAVSGGPGPRAYFAMARSSTDGAIFVFGGVKNQFGSAQVGAEPWVLSGSGR